MVEHSSFVNSCCPARRGPPLIVSGSDDGTAKLWDMRHRGCLQTFPDKYQVVFLCLQVSQSSSVFNAVSHAPVNQIFCPLILWS
jgi:WD40 repeat protein